MKIDENLIKSLFNSELKNNFTNYSIMFRGKPLNVARIERIQISKITPGDYHNDYNYDVSGIFELTLKNEGIDILRSIPNVTFRTYIKVDGDEIVKHDHTICITSSNL